MSRKYIALLLFFMAGWSTDNSAFAEEKVSYRLKWLFNASTVGDIYADVQGFFQKNGLDVTVKEGGPERDAIRELELGHAQFGTASADQVIRALSKGSPVVVLAQLFQVNPLQWIYRSSKFSINRISDLQGKIIGITYGGNDESIMRTLLAKGNINENSVKFFSVRYDFTPFYQRRVDVWPVYRNAQGPIIAKKLGENGEKADFFDPSAFGVKFVANSLVTSARMQEKHPETVRKFTLALLAAWEAALAPEYAEKALSILAQFDKDTPADMRNRQLELTRPMIKPSAEFRIGTIDREAWLQTEQIMLTQKLVPHTVSVEKVLMPLPEWDGKKQANQEMP